MERANGTIFEILSKYSCEEKKFIFSNVALQLKPEDVAILLGLPLKGKEVVPFPNRCDVWDTIDDFCKTYFDGIKRVAVSMIETRIYKLLEKEGKGNDFIRIGIMHIASTFLFATTIGGSVAISFTMMLESLRKIQSISWLRVIHTYLFKAIERYPDDPIKASGCLLLLPFWLCEHSAIHDRVSFVRDQLPRVVRWSLLDTKDGFRETLTKLIQTQLSEEFIVPLVQEELDLLEDNETDSDEDVDRDSAFHLLKEEINRLQSENKGSREKIRRLKEENSKKMRFDGRGSSEEEYEHSCNVVEKDMEDKFDKEGNIPLASDVLMEDVRLGESSSHKVESKCCEEEGQSDGQIQKDTHKVNEQQMDEYGPKLEERGF